MQLTGTKRPTSSSATAVGQFEKHDAVVAGGYWSERNTIGKFDVGSGGTPAIATPRATFDDPHHSMPSMTTGFYDGARVDLDVGTREIS
jgi:hypothetical protein